MRKELASDFKPLHILEVIWNAYLQNVMSKHFLRLSQSTSKNWTKEIHGSITSESIPFVSHAKRIVKFCFI